jgi:hypothetical protein
MPRHPLVALLFAILLATAAWLLWNTASEVGPVAQSPSAAADAPSPDQPAAAAAAPAAALLQADTAAGGQPQRTAAATADAATAGLARIRGRLVDPIGTPLAGVTLELACHPSVERVVPEGLLPLPTSKPVSQLTAQTDADGRFEFALPRNLQGSLGLPEQRLVWQTTPPPILGSRGDQDLGNLVAMAAAQVSGVVRDAMGQPVAGAKVRAATDQLFGDFGDRRGPVATTAADGSFALAGLAAGRWLLRVASPQHLPLSQDLQLAVGEHRRDLLLRLQAGASIGGQVLDDRGIPVAGVQVAGLRKELRGGVEVERLQFDDAATTDAGGYFVLGGVAGASTSLRTRSPAHAPASVAEVEAGTMDLVIRIDRLAELRGVLRGSDGAPIAGSMVRLERAASATWTPDFDGPGLASTSADGSFVLQGVRPGQYDLVAEGASHLPARLDGLQVTAGQTLAGLRLQAAVGSSLVVVVHDPQGAPIAGATVRLQPWSDPATASPFGPGIRVARAFRASAGATVFADGSADSEREAKTDTEGRAVVQSLPAAEWRLSATHPDHAAAAPQRCRTGASGAVEVAVALRAAGYFEVEVVDANGQPCPGQEVVCQAVLPDGSPDEAAADDAAARPVACDANGRCRLGPLPVGSYQLALQRSTSSRELGDTVMIVGQGNQDSLPGSEQRVALASAAVVQVRLQRPALGRLHGRLLGPDGAIAGGKVSLHRGPEELMGLELPGFGSALSRVTNADGQFDFRDLEAGDYTVRYGRASALLKAELRVTVPAGGAELEQDLLLQTGTLRLQAWDPAAGEPVADVEVQLSRHAPDGKASTQRRAMVMSVGTVDGGGETTRMNFGGPRAMTGADGWAVVEDVPAGAWDLQLESRRHAPSALGNRQVLVGRVTDCGRVDLHPAGAVRGTVLAADGSAVELAMVHHKQLSGTADAMPRPAQQGKFRVDGLAPGRYRFWAKSLGLRGPSADGPAVEVEVVAGETQKVELRLPPP